VSLKQSKGREMGGLKGGRPGWFATCISCVNTRDKMAWGGAERTGGRYLGRPTGTAADVSERAEGKSGQMALGNKLSYREEKER